MSRFVCRGAGKLGVSRQALPAVILMTALLAMIFTMPNYADDPPDDDPYVVTTSDDVSGDSVEDAVIADPAAGGEDEPGEVRVTSGSSGELTVVLVGKQSADKFGRAVAVVDALNVDQHKDLVIGAPKENGGRAYVFLGPFDESCPLYLSAIYAYRMFASPDADTFDFGAALNSMPDMDEDGFDEILIRATFLQSNGSPAYKSYIFSGNAPPGGSPLYTLDGDATFQSGGSAMSSGGESCYGDITGPSGEPNGVVDVDDMLLVINTYGQCPALPDPCPADIAPRGTPMGNGVVDVDDLLAVINAWGPCPPPGVVYTSNGNGGGDWFDPNTWNPPGVPGLEHHWDDVRILPGDTVSQSQKTPFTLGFYMLDGGTHVFSNDADIAALIVEVLAGGSWLNGAEMEALIVVRNNRLAWKPINAEILRVFECATFCELLQHPWPPFDVLPSCTEIPCTDTPP